MDKKGETNLGSRHKDTTLRLEKMDISGRKMDMNKCPVGSMEALQEKRDIIHLEGAEKFDKPMQDYYKCADEMSKIFAITLGLKLKVFEGIEELGTKNSVKDIMNKLNFKSTERHLIDFLDQLYVHGLVDREGILENARYFNTEYTRLYLLSSSVHHYNYIFLNLDRYMKKYETFEKNFPSGKTMLFSDEVYANEEDLKSYMEYFYKSNTFNFEAIIEKIDFSKYRKVVDVHGLAGMLAIKIKRKFPMVDVISFDNKKLQSIVESRIKGNEMWESIKLEYGNLHKDKIPEADCVLAPHILMHYSLDNRRKILKGIFDRLPMNGDLIILENLIDENRSKDDCGMKISFMFTMMGYEGFAMTFEEYRTLLTEVGFTDVMRIPRSGGVSDIVIAKKLDKSL